MCIRDRQCFELAAFDIPIDLVDTQQPRIFAPVTVHHPLPSLVPPLASHDFGIVDPGNTVNLYLDLENIGEMYLEGWAEVVGDPDMQVFPAYFYAESGETDGLVVSFSPEGPGERSAFLRITSNDPLQPELEIPIRGEGMSPEPGPGESMDEGYRYEGRTVRYEGCGCHSAGVLSPWVVALLPLVYTRRRRA